MRYLFSLLACVIFLLPVASEAQYYPRRATSATINSGPYNGPAVTFKGTLKAISKKDFTIDVDLKDPAVDEKQTLTFRFSRKTKFLKDDKEIKPADLAVGMQIMVDATRDGDQKLSALNVISGKTGDVTAPN